MRIKSIDYLCIVNEMMPYAGRIVYILPFFVAITCCVLFIYRIRLGWKSIQKRVWIPFFVVFLIATGWFLAGKEQNPLSERPFYLWISAIALSVGAVELTDRLLRRNPFPRADASLDYEYLQIDREKALLSVHEPVSEQKKRLTRRAVEHYFRQKKPYLDPKFRLEDLGAVMRVNRTVISHFINETYGMNFRRYVNRWRLREYQRLRLLLPGLAPDSSKIYTLSGFSDMRHYHRALDLENRMREAARSGKNTITEPDDDPA